MDAPGVSEADVAEIAACIMRLAESIEPMEPIEIGAYCTCCSEDVDCAACQAPPAEPAYVWTTLNRWLELCVGGCAEQRRMAQFDPANGALRIAEIDSFEGPNGERLWYPR